MSSISSAPVRCHFGIWGAHICENFLSEKSSWFARILELKASSQEPLDVDRWQASCCYFLHSLRGDELALGDILQLSSTMDKHKVARFPYTVAFTWVSLAPVCVRQGALMSAMSSQPLHISAVTRLGRAEWLPLSASPPWGEENTYTHYNRVSCYGSVWMHSHLWLGRWDGREGMCEISVWEGCRQGGSSVRQSEWASCRSNITNRLAAWEGLPNIIHMCYILSEPLPGLVVRSRREGGVHWCVCVRLCVCARLMHVRGQLESAPAVKWSFRCGCL